MDLKSLIRDIPDFPNWNFVSGHYHAFATQMDCATIDAMAQNFTAAGLNADYVLRMGRGDSLLLHL